MNKNALQRQMMSMKTEMLIDLQNEIDEEMKKSPKKRDCKKISELSDAFFEISCGNNDDVIHSRETAKKALVNKISKEKKINNIKLYRHISVAAACLTVVLFGLNTASMRVFGQNMFSAIYQLSKDGITIDMKQQEDFEIKNNDPYGMKAKCAEYGFFPDTPSYIPTGFILADTYEKSDSISKNVKFFYRKGEIKLNFDYHYYNDSEDIAPTGIPTDTYNVTEEQINGHMIYILREENQYTATYLANNIVYCIVAHNLDYEIYRMILENMS